MKLNILFILFFFANSLNSLAQKENIQQSDTLINSSLSIGNDTIVSLPIVYKKDGVILIKVIIDDKEYVFVFDTGATTCLISKEISYKNEIIKSITYEDAFGNKQKAEIVSKNFKIGNSSFNNIHTIVSDLKSLNELSCIKIDGIIGANLINLCNWQIDPKKQTISFSKSPFHNFSENTSTLKLEYAPNGLPHLKVSYDKIPFYVLIDFGFAGYLYLHKDLISKSKKLKKTNGITGTGRKNLSVNSIQKGAIIRKIIDTIVLENLKVANIPTNFDDVGPIIGASFFHRYNITLNTSDKNLILSPLANEDTVIYSFPIKFGINSTNELIVDFIWETEEIKNTGIAIGQKILRVNDKTFDQLSNSDLCELKNYLKDISKINITVQTERGSKELELSKSVY